VALRHLPAVMAEVVSSREEPYVLPGRDVLNLFRMLLDGPQLALEIE
jgi:hypothetical protein